jgi:hypothetical protein
LADAELTIVEFDEFSCGPSLPPDRLQVALILRFHFSPMDNWGLIIVLDSPLARPVQAMR